MQVSLLTLQSLRTWAVLLGIEESVFFSALGLDPAGFRDGENRLSWVEFDRVMFQLMAVVGETRFMEVARCRASLINLQRLEEAAGPNPSLNAVFSLIFGAWLNRHVPELIVRCVPDAQHPHPVTLRVTWPPESRAGSAYAYLVASFAEVSAPMAGVKLHLSSVEPHDTGAVLHFQRTAFDAPREAPMVPAFASHARAVFLLRDGRIVHAAPTVCGVLGWDLPFDELLGSPFLDLVEPHDRCRMARLLAAGAMGGRAEVFQRHTRAGQLRVLEVVSPLELQWHDGPVSRVVVRDRTSREHALEALARSEGALRALVSAIPDTVIAYDAEGNVETVMGGSLAADLAVPSKNFDLLSETFPVGARQRASLKSAFMGALVGVSATVDLQLMRQGRPQQVEVRWMPREPQGAIVVARDVTERIQEGEHRARHDHLASLGLLSAGVAHEINNPLTWLMGRLEVLDRALSEPQIDVAFARDLLRGASDGARRVAHITRDLYDFARVPDEEDTLIPVSVREVVNAMTHLAGNQLRLRASLHVDLTPGLVVMGTPTALGQIVLNLLLNAIQAIPEGTEGQRVSISAAPQSPGWVALTVTDTGLGLSEEEQTKIFSPFYSIRRGTGSGLGLGLSIVKRLVDELGGRLELESEPGQGSAFTVLLPTGLQVQQPLAPSAAASSLAPTAATRILVVDDEPEVAEVIRLMVQPASAVCVSSAAAASTMLESGSFDAVFCDVMMPTTSGIELFEQWRAGKPDLARRFVFMTGGTFKEDERSFLELTEQPVLRKPFRRASVLGCLSDVLEASRAKG